MFLVLVYLGAEAQLRKYLAFPAGPIDGSLLVAIAVAFIGWRRYRATAGLRTYTAQAWAFGFIVFLSAVAAWTGDTTYEAVTFIMWFAFIIPGAALVLTEARYRNAMLFGFAIATAVYGLVVLYRFARGQSVLDSGPLAAVGVVLGQNRNLISIGVLMLMPFCIMGIGGRYLRLARWPLVVLGVLIIFNSGGRSGLLGLTALALLLVLAHPLTDRRIRVVAILGMVGVLFLVVSQSLALGGSAGRLFSFIGGERTDSDNVRELLGRKAWNLAIDNPVFGVGFGNFEATNHPVLEEAENSTVRERASTLNAHNTYAEVLAETGFPGLIAFLTVLGGAIVRALRNVDRPSRFAAAGFGAVMVTAFFDAVLGPALYLPLVVVLGTTFAGHREPVPA